MTENLQHSGIMRQPVGSGSAKLQRIEPKRETRTPDTRLCIPRDVRRSIVVWLVEQRRGMQEVQLRVERWLRCTVSQRDLLDVVEQHFEDEAERRIRRVLATWRPLPPGAARRAA